MNIIFFLKFSSYVYLKTEGQNCSNFFFSVFGLANFLDIYLTSFFQSYIRISTTFCIEILDKFKLEVWISAKEKPLLEK